MWYNSYVEAFEYYNIILGGNYMNTMPMITRTISSVSQCWLYQDRIYKYMENGFALSMLPTVGAEYKHILEEFGIPHRADISGLNYEFWDPDCYKTRQRSLPLYIYTNGEYRYIKNYTGTVVSNDTRDAAFMLNDDVVKPEIKRLEEEKKARTMICLIQDLLNGQPACGVSRYANPLLQNITKECTDIVLGDEHYKIFKVHTLMTEERKAFLEGQYWDYCGTELNLSPESCKLDTDYLAIFNVNECEVGYPLEIQVPVGTEPIFVGRKGWQVKDWCKELGGLLKINVKPESTAA